MSDASGNRFRAALHGFNREDVVAYIEKMTQDHALEVQGLQEQNQQLQRRIDELSEQLQQAGENASAREALEEAENRVDDLRNENQALHARIATLEEELAERSELPQPAQPDQDLTAPMPAVSEVLAEQPQSPDYAELELAAYRRAEMAERIARERAADVYREVSSVFDQANSKLDLGRSDLEQMTKTIQADVNQLVNVLANIRSAYSETESSFGAVSDKNRQLFEEG